MNLQKRLSGNIFKCSPTKVHFDQTKLNEIKEAITKSDLRTLIIKKVITRKPDNSPSRYRTKHAQQQKRKGRRQGHGSRKGTHNARLNQKKLWINGVRLQRQFLKKLRDKKIVTPETYHTLYARSKGGFFRSLRHLKLYVTEQKLILKK